GTVVGTVTSRGKDFIEVKADGEEKARRYAPHFPGRPHGTDKATLELMPKISVGTRVQLDWLFAERPRVLKVEVLGAGAGHGKAEKRSGTIAGEIKSKKEHGKNIVIEVLAPGEEKARSYFVQWDSKVNGPMPEVLKAVRAANVRD